MIIIKVQGGLGNQLLQYSIGRVIAFMYGKEVAYDLSFFEGTTKYTKRPYLLDMFMTTVRVASKEEIQRVKYPYGAFSKILDVGKRVLNRYVFKTYYVGYDKNFLTLVSKKKSAYFEGFWQSFKYYQGNLDVLSHEISLKSEKNLVQIKKDSFFDSKTSVAVHVRRGDYLNVGTGIHVLSKKYYEEAVSSLEKKISNPTYFIFSDDTSWVKEEMGYLFKDAIYASSFSMSDYEEFSLMKDCQHAIIANSTFSWFSALLSDSPYKIVVYSKDWKNKYLHDDVFICPKHWMGL
jgi:hypothetical protein